jgi:hypothetical protein
VTRILVLLVLSRFQGGGLSGPDLEKSGRNIRPKIWVTRISLLLVLSRFQGWPDYPAQIWKNPAKKSGQTSCTKALVKCPGVVN